MQSKWVIKYAAIIFFVVFLAIGITSYRDYGVYWDEVIEVERGQAALNFMLGKDNRLANKYYGPAFELVLIGAQKISHLQDGRDVLLLRHLMTFITFFIGVIFFYFILKRKFKNTWWALLGSLFLIFSPRIWAHSFYNSKDIVFMSVFVIAVWTMLNYLAKKNWGSAILHALVSAFLIDVRIIGVFIPVLTLGYLIYEYLYARLYKKNGWQVDLSSLWVYIFCTTVTVILFWPVLWENPVYHFMEAFKKMSHFPWQNSVLYLGEYLRASELPWHYLIIWILISTPVLYLIGFIIGIFPLLKSAIKNKFEPQHEGTKLNMILGIWFFVPFLLVIVSGATLYDGWRQMFFIYPALIAIATIGLRHIYYLPKNNIPSRIFVKTILTIVIVAQLIGLLKFMVKAHPHEYIYFNKLSQNYFYPIKDNFELDYWGLSYRQVLEYILDNDSRQQIKIFADNIAGVINAGLIQKNDRRRLKFVDDIKEADYFISNYRWHKDDYACENEFYTIKIYDQKIAIACKLR